MNESSLKGELLLGVAVVALIVAMMWWRGDQSQHAPRCTKPSLMPAQMWLEQCGTAP